MSDIYSTLNPQQQEAVYHTEGPLLILAGAGSGKTRVLTHRIAYLIDKKGINPWNILAITFTNKAASEMRERVDKIVGFGSESVWVSTFHSTCVRILRRYIDRLGYDTRFAIYDTEDQKTLMKEVCRKLNIDTKKTKERSLLAQISHAKDELITPDEMELNAGGDFVKKKVAEVYREYQAALRRNNALDFDDLIVKTVELFQNCGDVLENYQERFRYIMVDEYQDTNTAQFKFISLLASKYENLCVVGDDDQSIYKFRGANIGNILGFEHVFPDAKVIRLEQNYRSTKNILNAANAVIANNTPPLCSLLQRRPQRTGGDRTETDGIFPCEQHWWNPGLPGKDGRRKLSDESHHHWRGGRRRHGGGSDSPVGREGGDCHPGAFGVCLLCQLRPALLYRRGHHGPGGTDPADAPGVLEPLPGGRAGAPRGHRH